MKTIVTMTLNQAVDKCSRADRVVAESKLYCKQPRFEPGRGGVNVFSGSSRNWEANPCCFILWGD